MNRYPLWKYIAVSLILLAGLLYTLPNFFGESPAVQISPLRTGIETDEKLLAQAEQALKRHDLSYDGTILEPTGIKIRFQDTDTQIKARDVLETEVGTDYIVALNLLPNSPMWMRHISALPMYLGLDLRGGVHFLLQVDMEGALQKSLDRYSSDIRSTLREKRIPSVGIDRERSKIIVRFRDSEARSRAITEFKKNFVDLVFEPENSDGQTRLLISVNPDSLLSMQNSAVQRNITTLRNRVNELGVAEPIIQQAGADRVIVQLPGVQDTAKAKDILGRTATLEVRMVDEDGDIDAALRGTIPPGSELFSERGGGPILVKKQILLTGDRITDAQPGFDQDGQAAVHINLDNNGSRIFKQLTRNNVGKRMAILLVEKNVTEVVTAPVIREEIGGGRVQISGQMSSMEARDVSLLLRAGALAAPMEIVEERTVGPSLGAENIDRGFKTTLYGFIAVALFIIMYYAQIGVISVISLSVNLLLLIGLLSILQATLTLPGMAAIALTLGMAIDANVLINERIRDEMRHGATPQQAIHAGYERAWDVILDANLTTLFAGIALLTFGSGPVKGFAVVLCLGIMTSVFSAVTVSRALVNLFYGNRKLTRVPIGSIKPLKKQQKKQKKASITKRSQAEPQSAPEAPQSQPPINKIG